MSEPDSPPAVTTCDRMKATDDGRFTMDSYAKGLAAMLQDSSLPVPLLIGVHGKYGSGKTHLIKAVLWKVRRVCGFSCSNLGRPVEQAAIHWTYSICCCSMSFFRYLLSLTFVFIAVVAGVMSFMIWASVVYNQSLPTSSTTTALPPPTTTTLQPPPPLVLLGNETASFADEDPALPLPPAIDFSRNDVLYPLLAASAFMGAGLLLVLITVIAYYCHNRDGGSEAPGGRWRHLKSLLVMLMCDTPPPPPLQKHDKVEVVPVVFNAWEYAGCDVLWAGIIKNIFHQVEDVFGKWKLRFYRTFRSTGLSHQHDPSVLFGGGSAGTRGKEINAYFGESLNSRTEAQGSADATPDPKAEGGGGNRQAAARDVAVHTAKWLLVPYPIWALLTLSTATVSVLVMVLLAAASNLRELVALEQYIQIAAGVLFGLTALSQLSNLRSIMQSACTSQAGQLERAVQKMKGPDVNSSLGFMHTIKVEVQRITGFVRLMERVYQKKFRILIVIDDLDKCESSRIVSILDSISILLSDEDSLFVTLVAIDHEVIAGAVAPQMEGQGGCRGGSKYLKRRVQMRFYMPEWTASDMESALDWSLACRGDCPPTPARTAVSRSQRRRGGGGKRLSNPAAPSDVEMSLIAKSDTADVTLIRKKLRRKMTKLAMQEMKNQVDLLPKSFCDVRHLCNMVFFTVYMWVDKMQIGHETLDSLQQALAGTCAKLTWWVIMTEEWPYRCSWMLKHVEDMAEKSAKASHGVVDSDAKRQNMPFSEVYQHVRDRLKEPDDWKEWMNYDANQEHFEMALDLFPLTCQTVQYFLPFTINLDRTIKHFILDHCKTREEIPCSLCKGVSLATLDSVGMTPGSSGDSKSGPGAEPPTSRREQD